MSIKHTLGILSRAFKTKRDSGTKAIPERGNQNLLWMRALPFGLALVIGGIAVLQYATPPGNTILTNGIKEVAGVSPSGRNGQMTGALTNGGALKRAASLDVDLSFQVKVTSFPKKTVPIVIAGRGEQSVVIYLYSNGFFSTAIPLGLIGEHWQFPLESIVPDRWTVVRIVEIHDRSIDLYFNNQLAGTYSFNAPAATIVPTPINLGVPSAIAGVTFRDVKVAVTPLQRSTDLAGIVRTRFIQILGALMIAAGTMIVAERILRKLIPKPSRRGAPLVRAAFGTAALGTLADVVFLAITHQSALYYSKSTWLFSPVSRFSDFFQTLGLYVSHVPYSVQIGSYLPFGYVMLAPFAWVTRYAALFVLLSLFIGFTTWWIVRSFGQGLNRITTVGLLLTAFASLPITFAIDRANTDLILFVILALGGAALEQRREKLSAFYFALLGAAKILPIAYLAVFFRWKRSRFVLFGLIAAGIVTILSALEFPGSVVSQLHAVRVANANAQSVDAVAGTSTPFNTSITGWLQALGFPSGGNAGGQSIASSAQHLVTIEGIIGALLVLGFLVLFERTDWRAVTLVTCTLLLLPDVSAYYSLIYLFVPLAMFVRSAPVNRRTIVIAVLFGLTLAPKSYAFWGNGPFVDSSVLLTAPLLFLIAASVVWDNLATRRSNARGLEAEPAEHSFEALESRDAMV